MRPFFLLLLLLLLLHVRCIAGKSAHVSPELRALMSIKAAITKDPDSALASWDQNTVFCKWRGVTCKPHLFRVTALDISNLDLGGTLSPQIGRLQFLESLSVAGNFLSGPIPAEIGGLRHLRYLNLSGNQFNLSFPEELYGLPNLRVLDVYNNNMTGEFLTSANLVTKLRHLNVGGNYFTGKIPPELGSFPHLEYLAVSGNSLTGAIPPEIGNLKKLKEFYIGYYNSFSGGIPKEIGNLSNLVVFDAGNCDLSGAIPPAIGNLKKLESLYLPQNRLSSGFPPELGKLTNLNEVDLTQNMLTGTIPSSFAQLKNLRLFSLFLNKLSGSIPDFIAEFPKLEVLLLWGNNFSGIIPQNLGTNQSLSSVDVSSNNLIGNLPPNLCNGNRLSTLIVKNNLLSGPVPESLGLCTSLRRLLMNNNNLTGHIPRGLFSLPNLNMADLQSNRLSGPFPTTDKSVSLGMIILSNNSLSGALPPSIGNFVSVNKLLLDGNMFSGRIPAEISKLHMLSTMNFSNNRFSNSIPPEISLCGSLIYLDLSQNQLSGEIPNAISDLYVLHYLNLSRNHLTGTIPVSIASMLSLTSTDFSYNNLSGSVPNIGQFNNFHNESFAGNPGLCGPLLNPCGESVGSEAKSQDKTSSVSLALIILQCIVLPVCSIAIAMVVYAKYKFLNKSSSITEDHDHTWKLTAFQPLDFKCCDVVNCLKEENIIGKGGAGIVYKGDMPNGQEVAVKRLPAIRPGSENDRGFKAEIETLGPIRHRYIVQLLGYSTNKQTNLLIYEHMPNGSLGEVLHGNRGGLLHWETRYKIAVQAAKGLCYLHNDCKPLIIHRDVKSNNILLDANFDAHIADFGLAKFLLNTGGREYVSAVAGSYGYIAPEYAYSLQVDDKSDVYSFGVVLLELITGKRPIGGFSEGVDIVEWARNTTGEEMEGVVKILDPRLPATTPLHEVQKMFRIAMRCVEEQPTWRPCIRKVIQMLTEPLPPPPPYLEPMGFSSLF